MKHYSRLVRGILSVEAEEAENRGSEGQPVDQSWWYDGCMKPLEWVALRKKRRCLWQAVTGPQVLEVGVGTGLNVPHYPSHVSVTGVDCNAAYLQRARLRASRLNCKVTFVEGDLHALPIADSTFDDVVGTFVFCSVQDPLRVAAELFRVLRPGGRVWLLDHGHTEGLVGRGMIRLAPAIHRRWGDHIARDAGEYLEAAGFTQVERITRMRGLLRHVRARKT